MTENGFDCLYTCFGKENYPSIYKLTHESSSVASKLLEAANSVKCPFRISLVDTGVGEFARRRVDRIPFCVVFEALTSFN